MHKTAPRTDEVECIVWKGELLRVTFDDIRLNVIQVESLLREFDGLRREINRRDIGAHPDKLLGEDSGAAGDIEELLPLQSFHIDVAREERVATFLHEWDPLQKLSVDIAIKSPRSLFIIHEIIEGISVPPVSYALVQLFVIGE